MHRSGNRSFLPLVVIGLLAGCSQEATGPSGPVAAVEVSLAAVITAGESVQASATPRNAEGGALAGRTVIWSSSDVTVMTVSGTGLVTAIYPGTATITATSEGLLGTALRTVQLDPAFAGARGRLGVGVDWSCGVKSGGVMKCWGSNGSGQLGDGTQVPRLTPVTVAGGFGLRSISGGVSHTCGLTTLGAAYCWGDNANGQLGDSTTNPSSTPVAVSGGRTFSSISAGLAFTCGVASGGAAYCWGADIAGNLGTGTGGQRKVPTAVAGGLLFSAVEVADGDEGAFACGITLAGAAYCWGSNYSGELGANAAIGDSSNVPVAVAGGRTYQAIGASDSHACALTTVGDVYCWGWNHKGQLGDGTTTDRSAPVLVTGGLRFAALSVGEYVTCGLSVTGAASCWGVNSAGQLGRGSVSDVNFAPAPVSGGLRFAVLSTGWYHTCGITIAGAAHCWGGNGAGQLGSGNTSVSLVPAAVLTW